MQTVLTLIMALICSFSSHAARVELTDGSVYRGTVRAKDDLMSIKSTKGTWQFRISKLKNIKTWAREYVLVGEPIELKKEPLESADPIYLLHQGTTVSEVGRSQDGWKQVRVFDTTGWVRESFLQKRFDQKAEPNPIVEITTTKGVIRVELYEDDAPNTVSNFIVLTERGFYDGLSFHRREQDFLVQGGDPDGTGEGNPGYYIHTEIPPTLKNIRGAFGMADHGVDRAGSQFYILLKDGPHLDGRYGVFGKVLSGMEVADEMQPGDRIVEIRVIQKREKDYRVEKIEVQ